MAAESLLAGLNAESTQQELLGGVVLLLAAMLEKMPRVDANDRLLVNGTENTTTVAISGGQTLATVTTLTTLNDALRLNALGSGAFAKPTDAMPMHLSNAGATHIYDNVKVS
jgi:hypothetical protein